MPTEIRTAEELLRNPHIGHCELIRRELHMMVPPGAQRGWIAAKILVAIANHVESRDLVTV